MSSCLCAANPSHPEQRQQLKDTQKQSQFTSVRKHKTFKQSSSNLGEVPRRCLCNPCLPWVPAWLHWKWFLTRLISPEMLSAHTYWEKERQWQILWEHSVSTLGKLLQSLQNQSWRFTVENAWKLKSDSLSAGEMRDGGQKCWLSVLPKCSQPVLEGLFPPCTIPLLIYSSSSPPRTLAMIVACTKCPLGSKPKASNCSTALKDQLSTTLTFA